MDAPFPSTAPSRVTPCAWSRAVAVALVLAAALAAPWWAVADVASAQSPPTSGTSPTTSVVDPAAPVDPGATSTTSTSTTVPLRPVLPVPILSPPVDLSVDVELVDGRDPDGVVRGASDALADVALEGERYTAALVARDSIADELARATDRIVAAQQRLAELASGQQALDQLTERAVMRVAKLTRIRDEVARDVRRLGVRRYVDDPWQRELSSPMTDTASVIERSHEDFIGTAAVDRGRRSLDTAQSALDAAIARSTTLTDEARDVERETRAAQRELAAAVKDRDRSAGALPGARRELRRARAATVVAGSDLPLVALDAYWRAAATLAEERPACRLEWWLLAGVGRSESNHARFGGGEADPTGRVSVPIAGLPLDGTRGTRLIADSDGGRFDGDPFVDRAVGTMQFIPGTWRRWRRDGSGDGIEDPQNIYDGALTAGVYLCNSGPLDTEAGLRRAVFAYNRSQSYVDLVLSRGRAYAALAVPATPGAVRPG